MSLGLSGKTPIGIDIGSSRIKAAQLSRGRSGWKITAGASYRRTGGPGVLSSTEMERLLSVLDRAGFVGDRVVVGAPRNIVHTAVVDAPPRSSGAPIEQICAAEFARMYRLSPGGSQLHSVELPTTMSRASTVQMSVSGISNEDAEALVGPFDRAGLVVEVIDLGEDARSRACLPACRDTDELTGLLDVGSSGIGLSVFRDGESVYHRWLEGAGTQRLTDSIGRSFSLDSVSADVLARCVGVVAPQAEGLDSLTTGRVLGLSREFVEGLFQSTLRSLAYVLDRFPGEAVLRFRLIGGGAQIPGLGMYFGELAGLDVETLTPSACGFSGEVIGEDPAALTAIGHAIWGSSDAG